MWSSWSQDLPKPPSAGQAGRQGPLSLWEGASPSAMPQCLLLVLPGVWDASLGTAFCPHLPQGTLTPCRPVHGGTAPCLFQELETSNLPCHGRPHVPHSIHLNPPLCSGLGRGLSTSLYEILHKASSSALKEHILNNQTSFCMASFYMILYSGNHKIFHG